MTKTKKLGFVATAFIASSFVLAGGVTALSYNKTNAETVGNPITISDDFTQAGSMSDLNAYAYSHVAKSPDGHSFGLMPIDQWAQMANPESGWITYKIEADDGYVLQDTVVSFTGAISARSCTKTWSETDIRVCVSANGQDWSYVYSQRTDNKNPATGSAYGPEGDWASKYKWYDMSVELPNAYDGLEEVFVRYELRQATYTALNANAMSSTYVVEGEDGNPLLDDAGNQIKANYTSLEHYWGSDRADDETRSVLVYYSYQENPTHSQIGASMQNASITANQVAKPADIVLSEGYYTAHEKFAVLGSSSVYEYENVIHNADNSLGLVFGDVWGGTINLKSGYVTYKLESMPNQAISDFALEFSFHRDNCGHAQHHSKFNMEASYSFDNVDFTEFYDWRNSGAWNGTNGSLVETKSFDVDVADSSVVYIRFKVTSYEHNVPIGKAPYLKTIDIQANCVDVENIENRVAPVYTETDSFYSGQLSDGNISAFKTAHNASNVTSDSKGHNTFGLIPSATWGATVSATTGYFDYQINADLTSLSISMEYVLKNQHNADLQVSYGFDGQTFTPLYSIAEMSANGTVSYSTGYNDHKNISLNLSSVLAETTGNTLYIRITLAHAEYSSIALQNLGVLLFGVELEGDYVIHSNGASIRLSGENGIRFETLVNDAFVSAKESAGYTLTYGTFIMPVDYLDSVGALTEENLFGDDAIFCWGSAVAGKTQILHRTANLVKNAYTPDGYSTFYYSILNIKEENLNRGFVALGYIAMEKDGVVEYIFADGGNDVASTARSATYVAQKAIASGDLTGNQPHALWETYISKCDTASTRTTTVRLYNVVVKADGTVETTDCGTQSCIIGQLYSLVHSDWKGYTAVACVEIDGELCWSQQSCFAMADGTSALYRYYVEKVA